MAKKVRLTTSKFKALTQISTDIGQVFLATVVLGPLIEKGSSSWYVIIFGVLGMISFWSLSIYFSEKGKL